MPDHIRALINKGGQYLPDLKNPETIDGCLYVRDWWILFCSAVNSFPLSSVSSVSLQRIWQRRRGSSRAQNAAERSSTMSTRRSKWWRTYWWETRYPSLNLTVVEWLSTNRRLVDLFCTSEGLRLFDYFSFHVFCLPFVLYLFPLSVSLLTDPEGLPTEIRHVWPQTEQWALYWV